MEGGHMIMATSNLLYLNEERQEIGAHRVIYYMLVLALASKI